MGSWSSLLLRFTFTDRNTEYHGPKLPLRSLTSLGFAEFSALVSANLAHHFFMGAVHRHGTEISAFVIVCCCYSYSVKEFDNLEADIWDGEHLTKRWCLKGKLQRLKLRILITEWCFDAETILRQLPFASCKCWDNFLASTCAQNAVTWRG